MVGPTWVSLRRGSLLLLGAGSGKSESSGVLMLISLSTGEGFDKLIDRVSLLHCFPRRCGRRSTPRLPWTWQYGLDVADLIASTPSFSHPLLPGASLGGAVDLGSEEAMCSGDCVRLGWNRCRLLGPGKRCVTLWRVQKPQGEMWLLSSS